MNSAGRCNAANDHTEWGTDGQGKRNSHAPDRSLAPFELQKASEQAYARLCEEILYTR